MIVWKNWFHRKQNISSLKGKRIGVIGLGPRNGTTHISIALANFLSDTQNLKVCLIEQNSNNDFSELRTYLKKDSMSTEFDFHRVFYYPNIPGYESKTRLTASFDCTVFDLGHDLGLAYHTLELCDIRILVGTGAPWRTNEYSILDQLFSKQEVLTSWLLYINMGSKNQVNYYAFHNLPTFAFPYEPDPISPGEATNNLFSRSL